MSLYGNNISFLIEQLMKLPGIGRKSAQRLAFHIVNMPEENARALAESIVRAKTNVKYCSICCNLSDQDPCPICSNAKRNHNLIMVVENSRDMAAYEKTKEYNGVYHILHGAISPINGVAPSDLKIKELIRRFKNVNIEEVIIATNTSVEGEATAVYLSRLIKPLDIKVSRIAHGVPVGSDLEYVDEVTLMKALTGRTLM